MNFVSNYFARRLAVRRRVAPADLRAQRIDWVFGNAHLSNADVTQEMAEAAVDDLSSIFEIPVADHAALPKETR